MCLFLPNCYRELRDSTQGFVIPNEQNSMQEIESIHNEINQGQSFRLKSAINKFVDIYRRLPPNKNLKQLFRYPPMSWPDKWFHPDATDREINKKLNKKELLLVLRELIKIVLQVGYLPIDTENPQGMTLLYL